MSNQQISQLSAVTTKTPVTYTTPRSGCEVSEQKLSMDPTQWDLYDRGVGAVLVQVEPALD